jgi:hypothetical protein
VVMARNRTSRHKNNVWTPIQGRMIIGDGFSESALDAMTRKIREEAFLTIPAERLNQVHIHDVVRRRNGTDRVQRFIVYMTGLCVDELNAVKNAARTRKSYADPIVCVSSLKNIHKLTGGVWQPTWDFLQAAGFSP